ncbi:unnamed protein product [Chironomus riparius]|uniref:Uncharacterized protein n=1 Tax=Chironomus riparius TaxID=315576 RepID=A0A9N9S6H9_9DIPT|nr:unnamed protein product [Chironomus riparius]
MEQNSSNLQNNWKKFSNLNSSNSTLPSTSTNSQQHINSRTNASTQTNNNEIGSCAHGLDENEAKKIKEELERARIQNSKKSYTKLKCLIA